MNEPVTIFLGRSVGARSVAETLTRALEAAGIPVSQEATPTTITVGGDGAMLEAFRTYGRETRYLGINAGRLGFLQEVEAGQIGNLVQALQNGDLHEHRLPLLIATLPGGGTYEALNEVVIRAARSKTAYLEVVLEGQVLEHFAGDGLIVCTPTGSTGHNYAAGGTILPPMSSLYQVTALAPIRSMAYQGLHSFCAPANLPLSVRILPATRASGLMVIDGLEQEIELGSQVLFHMEPGAFRLLRFGPSNYWERLRNKFLGPLATPLQQPGAGPATRQEES